MAIEEAPYTVLRTDRIFQLRDYAPQVLAETIVDGDLEEAGTSPSMSFFPLYNRGRIIPVERSQ